MAKMLSTLVHSKVGRKVGFRWEDPVSPMTSLSNAFVSRMCMKHLKDCEDLFGFVSLRVDSKSNEHTYPQ